MRLRLALVALLTGCVETARPPPLDPDSMQRGALLFLDPRFSGDGTRSCAACHPGGGTNGRVYLDGEEVPPGAAGGRDVPALWGLRRTPPYLADGSSPSLEAVMARMLRVEMRGSEPDPPDRQALTTYVLSIPPFNRRRTEEDGTPVDPVTRSALDGFQVFLQARCDRCHPPPSFRRDGLFDGGAGDRYVVPTLRGVAETAPYGHDGRWPTLKSAVAAALRAQGTDLSPADQERLVDYLGLL